MIDIHHVGEVRTARELGYSGPYKLIRNACEGCGELRWTRRYKGRPRNTRCRKCACWDGLLKANLYNKREGCHRWKGGRNKMSEGYYAVMLPLDSPYLPMAWAKGYVLEHRLVMAQYLGRCLTAGESVHHINGIRDDNRIENLVIFERSSHLREHISRGYRDGFKLGYKEGFERGTRQANSVA